MADDEEEEKEDDDDEDEMAVSGDEALVSDGEVSIQSASFRPVWSSVNQERGGGGGGGKDFS